MTTMNQTKTTWSSSERRHLKTDRNVDFAVTMTALMSGFSDGTDYNIGSRDDDMLPAGSVLMDDGVTDGMVIPAAGTPAAGVRLFVLLDDTRINGSTHVGLGVMTSGDFYQANLVCDDLSAAVLSALRAQGVILY